MQTSDARPSSLSAHRLGVDFWKFWAGQAVSNLGSAFTAFALPLLIFRLTGSPVNLALATAAHFLPYLLFGLAIGAWVDRVNRKRMMIAVDVLRGLVIASIPLQAALGPLSVWSIYVAQFVNSTLSIAFDAGSFAAVPSLVERDDLVTANGRIQASYSAAAVVGPLLAGSLVALMPLESILLLDGLSFLVSACSLALVRVGFNVADEARPAANIRGDVVEGLRYVLGHPVLRNLALMLAVLNFVSNPTVAQLVLFAKAHLQASDTQVGWLFSAGGIGVIVFTLAAGWLRERWSFASLVLRGPALMGLAVSAVALTPWYWAALPLWGLVSGLGALFTVSVHSLLQSFVPNRLLGRVLSFVHVLAWSAIPAGGLIGGLAIQWSDNVALVYGSIGVLMVLVALAFSFTALRRAERYLPEDATPARGQQ